MAVQILNDFHGDGAFRDQQGTIWVRQSEMVEGMARAWDKGRESFGLDFLKPLREDGTRPTSDNPYRAAKGEQ